MAPLGQYPRGRRRRRHPFAYGESSLLEGAAGDDRLYGNGDSSTLAGGDGANTVDAYGNLSSLEGGAGDDQLAGRGGGDHTLAGGAGNDTLDGGAGSDLADYQDATTSLTFTHDAASGALAGTDGARGRTPSSTLSVFTPARATTPSTPRAGRRRSPSMGRREPTS